MNKFVHIGFPKNLSTTLQRDYFSQHPEIGYLGVGINSNVDYYNNDIEILFELYLKTCKEYKYLEKREELKIALYNTIGEIGNLKKVVGASFEHLSFSFSYDSISTPEKARRIQYLFGEDTKVIIILRNQFDLLKSLYREYVRNGFSGDFPSFISFLYKYQDRNFLYDLRYDLIYKTYSNIFGSHNIGIFLFEDMLNKTGDLIETSINYKLISDLNNFLNISEFKCVLDNHNQSIPHDKILINSKLNAQHRHNFGNHLLEVVDKHRLRAYFQHELMLENMEKSLYNDVIIKRSNLKISIEGEASIPLSYNGIRNQELEFLRNFFAEGNENLSNLINRKLPESYRNIF